MLRVGLIYLTLSIFGCGTSNSGKDYSFDEDCYPERKTTRHLNNETGTIIKVMDVYIISQENATTRYQACNLPDDLKVLDIKVVFSGMVKEIYATERRFATPFVLEKIKLP